MERNAFLSRDYQFLDQHMLIAQIGELRDIIACLPDNEALTSLRQEAEEARQALFDELCRRKAALGASVPLGTAPQHHVEV